MQFDPQLLLPAAPELLLLAGALVLVLLGAALGDRAKGAIDGLTILLLIGAMALIFWLPQGRLVAFNGSFVLDDFARFFRCWR
jgi:NADH-quinone oxidoreductase subunit N